MKRFTYLAVGVVVGCLATAGALYPQDQDDRLPFAWISPSVTAYNAGSIGYGGCQQPAAMIDFHDDHGP